MSEEAHSEEAMLARITGALSDEPLPQEEEGGDEGQEQAPAAVEGDDAPEAEAQASDEDAPLSWEDLKEVKVKVPLKNGSEEWEAEVPLDELRLGYMRQDDYQRKTQDVARQRAEAETQVSQAVGELRNQVLQQLTVYEQAVNALAMGELQGLDLNTLAMSDPARYVQVDAKLKQYGNVLSSLKQQAEQITAQAQQAQEQQQREARIRFVQSLPQELPGYTAEVDAKITQTALRDYGLRPEELMGLADIRYAKILHDAVKYRELQTQKPLTEQKMKVAPKVIKPGAKASVSANRDQELRERLRKSGGRDEAAAAAMLRQRMFG
jgi:hypothetical protein